MPANDLTVRQSPVDVARRIPNVLLVEDEVRLAALVAKHLSDLKLNVRVEHQGQRGLDTALAEPFGSQTKLTHQ